MKKFKYKAKLKGKKQKGEVDAETIVLAKQKLRADGYRDVVLTEIKQKKKTGLNAEITWGPFGSIPSKEILIFTKKISTSRSRKVSSLPEISPASTMFR